MRVALDVGSLLGPRTGIGVFTDELVRGLAETGDVDVVAYATSWRGRHDIAGVVPEGVAVATRPMAARPLRAAWRRSTWPPIELWTGPVDVVHGPNYVVPPARRAAAVVSVHDLTMLHFPEMCTADTLAYPALIKAAVRRGAWIHTDTHAIADEVIATFDVPADRVRTVHLAASPLAAEGPSSDAAAGRRLAGAERFVLALGTVEPRKDLPGLVAAFDLVADEDPDTYLVIAGPDGWGADALTSAIAAARFSGRIKRIGWVTDDDKAALLRAAAVLAYPSRYEGFGIPPLEAMGVGTPVVATDVPAVREVCGNAALLVAPGDPDALAEALHHALADVHRLSERGRDRSGGFTWARTVAGMTKLYDDVSA